MNFLPLFYQLFRWRPAYRDERGLERRPVRRLPWLQPVLLVFFTVNAAVAADLQRIGFNNPGLVVDLGVGLWAWPLPFDYDEDGDLDLVVVCPDKPYNGIYVFENPGSGGSGSAMPVFRAATRAGAGGRNCQISFAGGSPRILTPGLEHTGFREHGFSRGVPLPVTWSSDSLGTRVRANQWKYWDPDADGRLDLLIGVGEWSDYGWDDAFSPQGEWTRGPLHGFLFLSRNEGTREKPLFGEPVPVQAGGRPINVFGMPSPNPADFDGDGDLDILCGEFLDGFTYFENTGTRKESRFRAGRRLLRNGKPLRMDLQMITPAAVDWDRDGDVDLVVGDEDGRVAWLEHTGEVREGLPLFEPPRYLHQEAANLKFGALATPVSFDWDDDGDEDLIVGNTAGYIGFIENLDGGDPPRWAAPKRLEADGKIIRIQAGPNGSIQGPAEAKWGYTTLDAADWDGDGLPDLVVNSIWGRVVWFRNVGTRKSPRLAEARPVRVAWPARPPKPSWNWWNPEPEELVTQWRTTPLARDLNGDGLTDLVMLDHEGYLALFERAVVDGRLTLLPPRRIFRLRGQSVYDSGHRPQKDAPVNGLLRLNSGRAGKSGRRKLCLTDWDGDGRIDLLVNSQPNVNFLKNIGTGGEFLFQDMGPVADRVLAGHTTSPTVVDWDRNGIPDLLVGAEDGHFYYLKNPRQVR